MSDFKGKMRKIYSVSTAWGVYKPQTGNSPDPLAVFKGPTSKGRAGEEGGEGKGREGRRRK